MELDPQHRPLCVNQSLRKAALRPSDGLQSLAQSVHRLVVGTVHWEYGAVQPVEQSALPAAHRVDPVLLPAAMERSDFSRQVLEQGAPQRHIDHLHPPADCQDWLARLKKGPEQLQLRLVSLPVRGLGAPVFLPKEGRVHIPASAQDEPSAGQVRGWAAAGDRPRPCFTGRPTVVIHTSGLTRNLDGREMVHKSSSLMGPGQLCWASTAALDRTSAQISSTAPAIPEVLELRVRS